MNYKRAVLELLGPIFSGWNLRRSGLHAGMVAGDEGFGLPFINGSCVAGRVWTGRCSFFQLAIVR